MTLAELIEARNAAGAAYADAVADLAEAALELAALDRALANGNAGGAAAAVLGFAAPVDRLRLALEHRQFAPLRLGAGGPLDTIWGDAVAARARQILAATAA